MTNDKLSPQQQPIYDKAVEITNEAISVLGVTEAVNMHLNLLAGIANHSKAQNHDVRQATLSFLSTLANDTKPLRIQ